MVAPNVAKLILHAPEVTKQCKPGQFAHLYCGGGVYSLLRRPISICDVEGENLVLLYQVKGEGTQWLARLRTGDEVDMIAPLGKGCYELAQGQGSIIIAAGGIGYAPVVYLSRLAVKQGLEVRLALGARNRDSLYCLEQMQALGIPVAIATEDGSVGEQGFVTLPLERMLQEKRPACVYSCGPEPMLRSVAALAARYGVPTQVSLEQRMACGVGACKGCVVRVKRGDSLHYENVCSDGPVFHGEEVFFNE